jgi:hypothetical protein
MFDDWKRAWRDAVSNFHRELAEEGDASAPLHIRAMRRDVATVRGALQRLDTEIERAVRESATEEESLQACRRREQLALNIDDAETADIARDFAARHEERRAVLERKLAVLRDERALLARDLDRMEAAIPATAPRTHLGTTPDGSDADGASAADFEGLKRDARERAAAERLEELKRRMR